MTGRLRYSAAAIGVLVLAAPAALLRGQVLKPSPASADAPLAHARLNHVAVVVRDIDVSMKLLADMLGTAIVPSRAVTLEGPGGKAPYKVAFLGTPNFVLELDQPTGPGLPQAFLDRVGGPAIHHIGFEVSEPLERPIRELVRRGGTLTLGAPGGRFAFVDFTKTLGVSFELVEQGTMPPAPPPAAPHAIAGRTFSHVGFVFRDAQPAVNLFADVLGITAPTLAVFKPIDYLPGVKAAPDAHVKFVQLQAGGVNIEVIEPVGSPSPWADFVTARGPGTAAHHIAFSFGPKDDLDGATRTLNAHGGVWKKGKRGVGGEKTGSSPEFEFFDTLGMVIEVSGGGR